MTALHPLGSVAEVFNGKTPAKSEQRPEGYPVLKIRDVDETGAFKGRFQSFVDPALAERFRQKWVCAGDTLILNAAHNANYVGSKTFFARETVVDALATGEWLVVRPSIEHAVPEYLNFWLRSCATREAIRFIVKGIHLYPKDVAQLRIPLPALTEQTRIVDFLSRAEGIVRLCRQAQAKGAELIPALFLDMFGDPVSNPRRWPAASLSEVAKVISGIAKGRKLEPGESIELPYMRVANVKDGYLDLSDIKTIAIKKDEVAKLLIEPGDMLMTEGGDPDKLGRGALWRGAIPQCVHQNHIFKVRSDRARILPEYLQSLVGSTYGKNYFFRVAKKTTGIASINKTQLSAFPVLVAPLELQHAFAGHVESAESIAALQAAALAAAKATFDALLARAFQH